MEGVTIMKRLTVLLLAIVSLLIFGGCGDKKAEMSPDMMALPHNSDLKLTDKYQTIIDKEGDLSRDGESRIYVKEGKVTIPGIENAEFELEYIMSEKSDLLAISYGTENIGDLYQKVNAYVGEKYANAKVTGRNRKVNEWMVIVGGDANSEKVYLSLDRGYDSQYLKD